MKTHKEQEQERNVVASCQLQFFIASIFLVVVFVHAMERKWTPLINSFLFKNSLAK